MDKPDIKQFNEFITKAEERLGRKLKRTTGGKSDNHAVHGALDIGVNSNGLTHKEYLTLGLTASEFGLCLKLPIVIKSTLSLNEGYLLNLSFGIFSNKN